MSQLLYKDINGLMSLGKVNSNKNIKKLCPIDLNIYIIPYLVKGAIGAFFNMYQVVYYEGVKEMLNSVVLNRAYSKLCKMLKVKQLSK